MVLDVVDHVGGVNDGRKLTPQRRIRATASAQGQLSRRGDRTAFDQRASDRRVDDYGDHRADHYAEHDVPRPGRVGEDAPA
ncbi:hypothetical protein, partial [Brevibacterium sanguinis]